MFWPVGGRGLVTATGNDQYWRPCTLPPMESDIWLNEGVESSITFKPIFATGLSLTERGGGGDWLEGGGGG